MINVIYLVILFNSNYNGGVGASVSIPQANMKQCIVNQKNYMKEYDVKKAYCIVGVK